MNIDKAALETVDTALFEKVWKLYVELNEREQHFNDLQNRYRTLASTWLLATFAGIGFALSSTLAVSFPTDILVAGIAVAGALGIVLIWILDVLVYHQLLLAGYSVGNQLEEIYSWLPPIRITFSEMKTGPAVRVYSSLYYGGAVIALVVVAVLAIWYPAPVNQRSGINLPRSSSSILGPDKSRISAGLGKEVCGVRFAGSGRYN
jgi:hypothetical protein